jgi:hypothetical protein
MATNPFPIPSFVGGVSTQPESQRVLGQTSESLNTVLPIERGLSKRNGTIPIVPSNRPDHSLDLSEGSKMHFHWIDRDTSRRYLIIVSTDKASNSADVVQAFDALTGNKLTITYNEDAGNPRTYLTTDSNNSSIKFMTVGDTTFILNTAVATNTTGSANSGYTFVSQHEIDAFAAGSVTISNVGANRFVPVGTKFYLVDSNNNIVGTGIYRTTHDAYVDVTQDHIVLKYVLDSGTANNPTTDGKVRFLNTDISSPENYRYRDSYLEFPEKPTANGQYWYAANDSVGRPAGFYETQNTNNDGPKYKRIPAKEAGWKLDPQTMPVKLFYNGSGFTLSGYDWVPRYSGDTLTNPAPKFVSKKLTSMVFHQDRLWLAWDEFAMASAISDYGNFFLDNWRQVGDTDPIEVATFGTTVSQIRHMVSFGPSLVLFCTGSYQFEVRAAGDVGLTPSTVNIFSTTRHSVDHSVPPVFMGGRLFFLSKEDPTRLYEYFYAYDSSGNTAVDISLHVQGWLPNTPRELKSIGTQNMVLSMFDDDPSTIYIHYCVLTGTEKIQAAWCKWRFGVINNTNGTETLVDTIKSFNPYDSWVYILNKRGSKYYLDKLMVGDEANDSGLSFSCRLDRRFQVTGTYSANTKLTSWTLPFLDPSINRLILGSAFNSQLQNKAGFERPVNNTTQTVNGVQVTVLTCTGNFTAGPCFVGRSFNMVVELTPPYVKDQNNRIIPGTITIMGLRLLHKNTGYYKVEVQPYKRETSTHVFNPLRVGSATIGSISIEKDGEFSCKPLVSSKNMSIKITSDSHLPARLISGTMLIRFVPLKRNPAK